MRPRTKLSKNQRDALLFEVSQGVSKAFENAQELFQEAALLRSHRALSRDLFLHQISMEECGKIEILGATAVSLLAGFETELKRASSVVTKHKAKNYANAYLLPWTKEEKEAAESGDWKRALGAFKRHQAAFHLYSNTATNASLYVDFARDRFIAPKEAITEEMVAALANMNREFLALAEPKVRMLARWQADTDEVQKVVEWFIERAEVLKSQSETDPKKMMSVLVAEMLARAKASNYHWIAAGAESPSSGAAGARTSKERKKVRKGK